MFDRLTGTAYGIISFTVIIVIGSVVILNLGNGVGGQANTTAAYLNTQLGSTSGGLASYTPAIIAISVGVLFLSYFGFGGRGKSY